jgi:hypothetical protein
VRNAAWLASTHKQTNIETWSLFSSLLLMILCSCIEVSLVSKTVSVSADQ